MGQALKNFRSTRAGFLIGRAVGSLSFFLSLLFPNLVLRPLITVMQIF